MNCVESSCVLKDVVDCLASSCVLRDLWIRWRVLVSLVIYGLCGEF